MYGLTLQCELTSNPLVKAVCVYVYVRFVQQSYTLYCLFTYKTICIVCNSRKNIVAPCH